MATPRGERSRHISCWLSEVEAAQVEANMALAGFRRKSDYFRHVLTEPNIVVKNVAIGDPDAIRVELARIGNNVNQIARLANTHRASTAEDVAQAIDLLRQCKNLLAEAAGEA